MSRCVVAGVDGSVSSSAAADWAGREAAALKAELRLVHVAPGKPDEEPAAPGGLGPRLLERTAGELSRRHPELRITTELRDGDPAAALAAAAADAALLVVGARGAGGRHGLLAGGVALGAAAQAPCPVVLVPAGRRYPGDPVGEGYGSTGEVVLGVDAHDADGAAADLAFDAADRRHAVLRAVHAWHLPPAAGRLPYAPLEEDRGEWEDAEVQRLADVLRPWREKYPAVRVRHDVRLLGPAEALVTVAARAERIVLGRGGPGLGATADAVLRHARCPVLLAPTD